MPVSDDSASGTELTYGQQRRKDVLHGAFAGVLAGMAVMILFLAFDMLWFKPLSTPDFLSSALLAGGDSGAESDRVLRTARIAMFTTFHLLIFTLIGIALASFLRFTQLPKSLLVGGLYGLIACTAIFTAILQVTGAQMSEEWGWPALLAGNFLAGIVMVVFLRRAERVDPSN
ncbi:MAG: hypothetical protein KJO06_05035 [Gemmatimonadetes bacterium]|nr:hypothetical protein [Gemmatimonadota bacterium]